MKAIIFLSLLLSSAHSAVACTTCNKDLQQGIYNSTFYPNLFIMLSAFVVLTIVVIVLSTLSTKKYKAMVRFNPFVIIPDPVPLTTAAMVLGIGIGGFIDGIWLHQILQWHEMLSNKIETNTVLGKSVNMFWDGVFHFFCLIVVVIGLILLWKLLFKANIDRSGKLLTGGLLLGWGLFNCIEGVIDHHLLKLHNVKEISSVPEVWNISFLILSIFMLLAGYILVYKRKTTIENIHV